jgi:hypothetical protein
MDRDTLRTLQEPLTQRYRDAPGASEEQLATLLAHTERYCVVLRTLRGAPPVSVTLA